MRNVQTRNTVKDWVRLAAKLSLLFTEPKIRAAIGERIRDTVGDVTDTVADRYGDMTDTVANRYENAADRLQAAADALQGRSYRLSRVTGFLLGVGIGAGLGILLAPAAGSEIRGSVRDKAANMKNKFRRSMTSIPATGTEG